jgi:hypothetical protein
MARKFLYIVAALITLVIAGAIALAFWSDGLTRLAMVPDGDFTEQPPLAQERYDDPAMWLSHPALGRNDAARWLPQGFLGEDAVGINAAVFFVHSTSYLSRDAWNAPLKDAEANDRARLYVQGMASPFNRIPELWAPRYRQAAYGAFLTPDPSGAKAIELAYGDIALAFETFLAATDKDTPIVLAGHDQGALMTMRLLRDRVAGKPLAKRIVAAYVIGWPVSAQRDLPVMGLQACIKAEQTGCVVSWSAYAEPAEPAAILPGAAASFTLDGTRRGDAPQLCTNPLTGMTGGSAPASANHGTLVPSADLASGALRRGAVPAWCDAHGLLLIGPPPSLGPYVLPGNNYQVYDIPLFWQNLREDFSRRALAWKP